jgi:hypothetical protein
MHGLDLDFTRRLDRAAWRILTAAIEGGLNAPLTSSAGRLFDAVASLLGLRDTVEFEAQAAMELEACATGEPGRLYPTGVLVEQDQFVVRTTDLIRAVVEDLLGGVACGQIAARFHASLAAVIADACARIRQRTDLGRVALSGGVFQNRRLLQATVPGSSTRASRSTRIGRCRPTMEVWHSGKPPSPRRGECGRRLMCLAIPGKVVEVFEDHGLRMGRIDFAGTVRKACLAHVPEAGVGRLCPRPRRLRVERGGRGGSRAHLRAARGARSPGRARNAGGAGVKYLDEYRDGRVAAKVLASSGGS